MENPKTENPIGSMTAIILIILMLLVGAWYFLWQKVTALENQREQIKNIATTTTEYINLGTTTATSTH